MFKEDENIADEMAIRDESDEEEQEVAIVTDTPATTKKVQAETT